MDFKKLAEVELLEEAPEGATAFAEVNGEVKRVAGGVGGGGGPYVWDVSKYYVSENITIEEDVVKLNIPITNEEIRALVDEFLKAGYVRIVLNYGLLHASEIGSVGALINGEDYMAAVYGSLVMAVGVTSAFAVLQTTSSSTGMGYAQVVFPNYT